MSAVVEPRVHAWELRAEWPLAALAALFLVTYSIDILEPHLARGWRDACHLADFVIWGLFIVDYVIRIGLAHDRFRYWWHHIADVLILALPVLRPLRLLRLVMLLRVMNRRATDSLRGRVVVYVSGAAFLLVYCGALAMLDSERNSAGANIRTFGDAMWWAVTTVSTVGYGDRFPVTTEGRFVAVGLMIGGVALLGAVTASFASWLIDRVRETGEVDQAATRHDLHAVHAKLDRVEKEMAELKALLQGVERPANASS